MSTGPSWDTALATASVLDSKSATSPAMSMTVAPFPRESACQLRPSSPLSWSAMSERRDPATLLHQSLAYRAPKLSDSPVTSATLSDIRFPRESCVTLPLPHTRENQTCFPQSAPEC